MLSAPEGGTKKVMTPSNGERGDRRHSYLMFINASILLQNALLRRRGAWQSLKAVAVVKEQYLSRRSAKSSGEDLCAKCFLPGPSLGAYATLRNLLQPNLI